MGTEQIMGLADRWTNSLAQLQQQGRRRRLASPCGIDFSSNDYLAYAGSRRPACRNRLQHNGSAAGPSGTASRLLRGNHPIWEPLEADLAAWQGSATALLFSSGYAANEGLLSTVIESGDWVASDQLNHASIIDGLRLSRAERFVYRHNDLDHLEQGLKEAARGRAPDRELFLVTESLFGMDGDVAPLRELCALADHYGAYLIVDEAHATGCFGPTGAGLVDEAGLRGRVLATVHTGGKALGVHGGFVCGSELLREILLNRCRQFMFTTALPPALGAWWQDALAEVRRDAVGRRLLHAAAERFRQALAGHGIHPPGRHYIVPIIVGDDQHAVEVARSLTSQGWDIRAIRPPTVPHHTARLRVSLHADHGPDLLDQVAGGIARALREVPP